MKYSVGQKVIVRNHKEDATVVLVDSENNRYVVELDRIPGTTFTMFEHEIEDWKFRRFQVNGNHYKKMIDQNSPESRTMGSWAVHDMLREQDVFYVTSGHSKAVAQAICDAINDGTLLQMLKE